MNTTERHDLTLIVAERHCRKCDKAREILSRMRRKFPELSIRELVAGDPATRNLGAILPPALLVDGQLLCMGRPPSERRLEIILRASHTSGSQ